MAALQTSRCNCRYVSVRVSPGSPSQRMAAWLPRLSRCLSRQFSDALMRPAPNHVTSGISPERTVSNGCCQCSSSRARSPQNPAGSSLARCQRASYCSSEPMRAKREKSAGGGNVRPSPRWTSMALEPGVSEVASDVGGLSEELPVGESDMRGGSHRRKASSDAADATPPGADFHGRRRGRATQVAVTQCKKAPPAGAGLSGPGGG